MKNTIKKIRGNPFVLRGILALKIPFRRGCGQKGFILILALVTMLAMSLIGISLLMNITTDTALSRNEKSSKMAFQLAEAGINEAVARLHLPSANARYIGEQTADADYRTINWNVNNSDGRNFGFSTGGVTRDSAVGPDGTHMNYDVTITYLTENNAEGFCDNNAVSLAAPVASMGMNSLPVTVPPGTLNCTGPVEVVMFGQDFNINQSVTRIQRGIMPVYHVFSTGSAASGATTTTRRIEAYIGASSLNVDTGGALNTNGCVTGVGAASDVTGGSTCSSECPIDGKNCTAVKTADDDMVNDYLGDTVANVAAMADMTLQCGNPAECNAVISGTTDADWGDWTGDTYSRMIYINNATSVSITGNDLGADKGGRGILIVTGDLDLSGGFNWEGLIYVLGTLTLNGGGGGVNIVGGAMANVTVNVNGGLNLNYNLAVLQDVGRQSSSSAMLIWKKY
ncbi:MAG: hypothetical protein HZB82_00860 [Deltaproteobacteria bacterium]|nr:hypothetical protein [Deltaproteobacteria bacterium]